MQTIMLGLMTFVMLLNSIVWLGISVLILYNLYQYTKDKIDMQKLIHPYFRRFFPGL